MYRLRFMMKGMLHAPIFGHTGKAGLTPFMRWRSQSTTFDQTGNVGRFDA